MLARMVTLVLKKNIIEPCLKLEDSGMNLFGPLPADTIFTPKYLKKADAVAGYVP